MECTQGNAVHAGNGTEVLLDRIYRNGRTHHYWLPRAVPDELLVQAYDLAKMAPTTANSSDAFVVYQKQRSKRKIEAGAYFMLACRALGLDIGPMSGFDNAIVDAEFFAKGSIKSNWLCNIGYGDKSKLHTRSPRFEFSEIAKII